jgi:hypothetical protein
MGIYCRWSEFINCFHSRSCCVGAVLVFPCCLPIKAISMLKSLSIMMLLRGLLWIWLNIVVWIMGMRIMSSMCVGIYRCIRKYVDSGWFMILIICRYGEMFVVRGILVIFHGNV